MPCKANNTIMKDIIKNGLYWFVVYEAVFGMIVGSSMFLLFLTGMTITLDMVISVMILLNVILPFALLITGFVVLAVGGY